MDAMQALEGFKSSGSTKTARRFKPTPSLKFSKKGGEYVIGIFVSLRPLAEGSKAGKSVVSLELIDTNATFTIAEDETYKPVPVKVGDKVGIFAPTGLDGLMQNIEPGTEVYIRCDGKVKQVRNGKNIEAYQFDVRHK